MYNVYQTILGWMLFLRAHWIFQLINYAYKCFWGYFQVKCYYSCFQYSHFTNFLKPCEMTHTQQESFNRVKKNTLWFTKFWWICVFDLSLGHYYGENWTCNLFKIAFIVSWERIVRIHIHVGGLNLTRGFNLVCGLKWTWN